MSDIGHNSETVAAAELRQFCERRERLEEDKAAIQQDIKELHGELKGRGYDIKTFNEMIRLRKLDADERTERETLRQVYGEALGVFG